MHLKIEYYQFIFDCIKRMNYLFHGLDYVVNYLDDLNILQKKVPKLSAIKMNHFVCILKLNNF